MIRGILLALVIGLVSAQPAAAEVPQEAVIYYNEACVACAHYLKDELIPLLRGLGVERVEMRDYLNDPQYRRELLQTLKDWNIPPKLQGHIAVFIDEKLSLQGHVPQHVVRDLLSPENLQRYERILVLQDVMEGHGAQAPTHYTAWAFLGPVKTHPIETPITEYLDWLAANRHTLEPPAKTEPWSHTQLLPFVLATGLLDGINPCAIAVLLFFIAFLFTLQRARIDMLLMGTVYISMIYLAYLGIGIGLLSAIVITGEHHLMAQIGSWLLIALGLVNVKDYFWYGKGLSLSVPKSWHDLSFRVIKRATLPAAAVGGFLVGLCTFPCSGGIYVAVLGLLSAKTTFWTGFGYLLLYNLAFVAPLIALLLALGNRRTVGALARWEAQHKREVKLATGLLMLGLGAVILVWFV
jgi:cytochrome c biogenesis protein CcdA